MMEKADKDDQKAKISVEKEINLKDEAGPCAFVKPTLALEEVGAGEVLRIIVNHEPATKNVLRSMENEGNEFLDVGKPNDSDLEIVVRKGE